MWFRIKRFLKQYFCNHEVEIDVTNAKYNKCNKCDKRERAV
jgi:hypothetical protein